MQSKKQQIKGGMVISRKKQMTEPRRNFTVRLSEKEEELMKVAADANGLQASEYIRELIIHGGTVDTSMTTDRRDLINQISKVGNNINQLARLANTDKKADDYMLSRVSGYMQELMKLMMEVLKKWQ